MGNNKNNFSYSNVSCVNNFKYTLNTLKKGGVTWQYFEFIKRQVIL